MKIVFIAGPYNAQTREGIEANIVNAWEYAVELARRGIGFLCPHLNSIHFHDEVKNQPESFWYKMYLRMLLDCDAVLAMPAWGTSSGARDEVELAERFDIPRFFPASPYDLDALSSWYHE